MAKHSVFVDGGEGTTGLRICQRLAEQSDITVLRLADEDRKDIDARLAKIEEADITFLCLPDEAAKEIAALAPSTAKICDASTAHRTNPEWAYGLPELKGQRSRVASAARVAVPGCYATGFVALAAPLVEMGALDPSGQLFCHGISGYSGGGKKMIAAYESENVPPEYAAPREYALGMQHKHLPEMAAAAGLVSPPLFTPIVAGYYCGMLISLPIAAAQLQPQWNNREKLAALYKEYYANEALVAVKDTGQTPADGMLAANALAGRDDLEIFVLGNEENILLAARFDNLGKGASGAAVQCMNLMLGREETKGLVFGA